jgi:hypothetical protein
MADTKKILSGSTDGRRIKIAATSSPGTLIHTGPTSTTALHDIFLNLFNTHTSAVDVVFEWGGTTDPDDLVQFSSLPAKAVARGAEFSHRGVIKGNSTALVVRAYATVANKVTVGGDVIETATA